MKMNTPRLIFALFLAVPLALAAQTGASDDVFTISVAAPTSVNDVQVRYILNGDPTVQQSSSIAKTDEQRITVKTGTQGKPAKSFRAIVFAPGCQFATIKADNLATGDRQADFQCQKLTTVPLSGKADISRLAGRDMQVEALYVCGWAGQFFGMPGLAMSPFSVGKAKVETDGTFVLELPDFSGDPLWKGLSHNATLMLFLVDASTGEHLAQLSAPDALSRKGGLKVAASYPAQIEFAVQ
jgi:lipopolysaccharide export system protein LptA